MKNTLLTIVLILSSLSSFANEGCSVKCTYYFFNYVSNDLGFVSGASYDDLVSRCEKRIAQDLRLKPSDVTNQTIRHMNRAELQQFHRQINSGYLFMELLQEFPIIRRGQPKGSEWLVPYQNEVC